MKKLLKLIPILTLLLIVLTGCAMNEQPQDKGKAADSLQKLEKSGKGNIQNLENRLSWDAYYGIVSQEFRNVITWERDYNNSHILTGIKKALKELGVI